MPDRVAVSLDTLWVPKPTQAQFFEAIRHAEDLSFIAYVGAFGSGKSWAICRAVIGLAMAYPGIRILLGRFLGTDLRDTTQVEFFRQIQTLEDAIRQQVPAEQRPSVAVGTYHATRFDYEFSNGSLVLFRPLQEAEKKFKSLEIAVFAIDEGSEVMEPALNVLLGRRRQMGYPRLGLVVSNPTGRDHWLYQRFIHEPRPKHVLFRTNTLENAENLPE